MTINGVFCYGNSNAFKGHQTPIEALNIIRWRLTKPAWDNGYGKSSLLGEFYDENNRSVPKEGWEKWIVSYMNKPIF
jgi:hypothetical protein